MTAQVVDTYVVIFRLESGEMEVVGIYYDLPQAYGRALMRLQECAYTHKECDPETDLFVSTLYKLGGVNGVDNYGMSLKLKGTSNLCVDGTKVSTDVILADVWILKL